MFVCSFLAQRLGFECRGFPCVLEWWVWGFFCLAVVSVCTKSLRSNALTGFCLWLWGEPDASGIRNTSVSILSFLKLLHHSIHKLSSFKSLSKGLLVYLYLLNQPGGQQIQLSSKYAEEKFQVCENPSLNMSYQQFYLSLYM